MISTKENVSSNYHTKKKQIVVLTTTSSLKDARKIACALLDKRLAACISIICNVESVFQWKGRITTEKECLIIIKTKNELFNQVEMLISKLHPYEIPEIIALQITAISKSYVKWLEEAVK